MFAASISGLYFYKRKKPMKLDQAGIDAIKKHEDFRAFPYQDIAGKWTIGYGHLIKPGESFPRDISIEEAEVILFNDAQIAMDAVNRLVKVPITQNQFNALVSFTYNLGTGALAESSVLRNLNNGDVQAAADSFLLWNKYRKSPGAPLVASAGLTNRRKAEAAVFLS